MNLVWLCPLLLVLSAPALSAQEQDRSIEIKGKVVLADGSPVAGVAVAQSWGFENGKAKPYFSTVKGKPAEIRSGSDGRFSGRFLPWSSKAFAVFAVTDDRKLCGFLELDTKSGQEELAITLVPSVRVHGRLESKQLGYKLTQTYVVLSPVPGNHGIAQCNSTNSEFDVSIPPGTYGLRAYGKDLKDLRQRVKIDADKPDQDLGTLDVLGSFLALHRGMELPPWKVTSARGVPLEKTAISDFKGKWLFVEFWGFW